ncbi:unannotated protein [freshwater metagenome]|uniref:Unannotated protein n=1 Tax=freshwater metagenome TaxID=449393 RepID=A0A6J6UI25_9ZZZZ
MPLVRTTADAPAASAERKIVPRFPGSEILSTTTIHSDFFAEPRSAMSTSRFKAIAITGCGEFVDATRSITPGAKSLTALPAPEHGLAPGATN